MLRPLFFEFPTDANTLSIDQQFLVGPAVLITPVVTAGTVGLSRDCGWSRILITVLVASDYMLRE